MFYADRFVTRPRPEIAERRGNAKAMGHKKIFAGCLMEKAIGVISLRLRLQLPHAFPLLHARACPKKTSLPASEG